MISKIKRKIQNYLIKIVSKIEGGETKSKTLRKFFADTYKIQVGLYSYGCFKPALNNGGTCVTIGRYCSFADNVRYYGANHPLDHFSLSPFFYNRSFGFEVEDVERHTLTIGNDVWVGYGVIITSGCGKIGNGAVIAAGAIVTKDVPPYAIVGGNPAKLIRMRFNEDDCELLEQSKWWLHTPEDLVKCRPYNDLQLIARKLATIDSQSS